MIGRVVVLNDVSIARGGATGLALETVRLLRARGTPVTFITGDAGNNPELSELGVEVVALGQSLLLDVNPTEALFRGLYNRRTTTVVGDWIARNDTPNTLYHIHTWAKILSPSLFKVLRPLARRLIVSAHDFFLVCPNGGYVFYKTGDVCRLRPLSTACLVSSCDRRNYAHKLWRVARQAVRTTFFPFGDVQPLVLEIHDGMRDGLERGGLMPDAIRTLRNPVRAFSDNRITAELNHEAIFIGRMNEEKGADLAAAAATRAGIRLRVIGDGPMLEPLRRQYPSVSFEGQRTHAEIARSMQSARVLVIPSRYPEPFGLVAGESMWSGVPVILNRTAMMADEIIARGSGLACDVRNVDAFATLLRQVFDDDALTARMSRNAFTATRDLANTYADWSRALIAIYEERLDQVAQR